MFIWVVPWLTYFFAVLLSVISCHPTRPSLPPSLSVHSLTAASLHIDYPMLFEVHNATSGKQLTCVPRTSLCHNSRTSLLCCSHHRLSSCVPLPPLSVPLLQPHCTSTTRCCLRCTTRHLARRRIVVCSSSWQRKDTCTCHIG